MKASVKFSLSFYNDSINLEDYGYDEDVNWDDLKESQQNEISDSLRENNIIYVSVENK